MIHTFPPQPCKNWARCKQTLTHNKTTWCNNQCRQQWRARKRKEKR